MHHSSHIRPSFARIPAQSHSPRWWRDFPYRLLALYCIAVLGLIGFSSISGDRYWPVQAFGYVRDIALLLALIPLPIVIWRRRKHPVVLQLLCAILLIWTPASASDLPREAPLGSTEVAIMTLNTADDLTDPSGLMPYLEESEADIIGLQEVSPQTADAIEASTSSRYPHKVVYGLGIPGKALLSTFPILDHQLLDANPERPDLLATLDIDGTPVTVIVAHPPPPHLTSSGVVSRPGAEEQFTALIEAVSRTDGPLLLLGDLNITPHHDRYGHLESVGLIDAFAEAGSGPGYSYPARLSALDDVNESLADAPMVPLIRIDYIWGSDHWYPLQTWVADDAGSDHLPVVSKMAFLPE